MLSSERFNDVLFLLPVAEKLQCDRLKVHLLDVDVRRRPYDRELRPSFLLHVHLHPAQLHQNINQQLTL